jgi:hypothetical protein
LREVPCEEVLALLDFAARMFPSSFALPLTSVYAETNPLGPSATAETPRALAKGATALTVERGR